jgi:YidC/Oxa1 family membrane protein insertase
MIENKNMILAIGLSIVILVVSQIYFDATRPPPPEQPQTAENAQQAPSNSAIPQPGQSQNSSAPTVGNAQIPGAPSAEQVMDMTRADILARNNRVSINTPRLHGSIALTGGRIDDLTLADYRETLDPESREIVVLSPKGVAGAYYAQFGWVGSQGVKVPGQDTKWTADGKTLSPEQPVTLSWDNGEGLKFSRTFAIDNDYMFTITQSVKNTGSAAAALNPYGFVSRRGTPETTNFYILHEGMLGVSDATLTELDYDDIKDSGQVKQSATGGWIGITDKYWLAALIPDQKVPSATRFMHRTEGLVDMYQVDYLGPQQALAANGTISAVNHFFLGAKEVKLLDKYEEKYDVERFDLAIDYGWFYFLTKPIFYALLWLNGHVLNLGVSILILTVGIKILLFPLANKSYTSMSKMKKLAPEMTKLRERYSDDKMKLNQEMMALYKKEKVNPASGCLPILVQIPVFFALYKVLFVTIEMRHAPFFGWIQDLSAPDPTSIFNLFGLIPFTPPDFLMIGVWPLIMGISMYLQQKLNPQPTDPMQAKIFLFLPLMFTFMLAQFPAGLVIYWAWNNSLSMLQQWVIMRKMGITGKQALQ